MRTVGSTSSSSRAQSLPTCCSPRDQSRHAENPVGLRRGCRRRLSPSAGPHARSASLLRARHQNRSRWKGRTRFRGPLDAFSSRSASGTRVEELNAIIDRTTHAHDVAVQRRGEWRERHGLPRARPRGAVASHVRDFASLIVMATTRSGSIAEVSRRFVRYGSSPRGAQALVLGGRCGRLAGPVQRQHRDIRAMAVPALRHGSS